MPSLFTVQRLEADTRLLCAPSTDAFEPGTATIAVIEGLLPASFPDEPRVDVPRTTVQRC